MSNRPKPPTFQEQGDQHLREEALRMAKATQSPGQTKEQTKLIAKGIEKGIAQFKQQQKEKARERDKARKRALREARASSGESLEADADSLAALEFSPARIPLLAAGTLFLLGSLAHVLRWILGWDFQIGDWSVSLAVSAGAALVLAGLAAWMFYSAGKAE